MVLPDFLDTFQHADTDDITGLVSDSGHAWAGSGVCQPCIRSGKMTSEQPLDYNPATTYRGAPFYDSCRSLVDGLVYVNATGGNIGPGVAPPGGSWSGESGDYAYVDVLKNPKYQYADVSWDSADGALVLIASNRDNNLTWMTHFYFGRTGVNLQMRGLGDGSPTSFGSVIYTTPVTLGVVYRVGIYFDGSRMGIQLPDGSVYRFAHQKFADVYGRYLCYQPLLVSLTKVGCTLQERRLVG